jgi:uncharacterized membrane protein YgcG
LPCRELLTAAPATASSTTAAAEAAAAATTATAEAAALTSAEAPAIDAAAFEAATVAAVVTIHRSAARLEIRRCAVERSGRWAIGHARGSDGSIATTLT